MPAATLRHDPWLVLAAARRHRAEGRWAEAIEAFQRAELAFGGAIPAQASRRERLAIAPWIEPSPGPPADWSGRLRAALGRDPLLAAREPLEAGAPGAELRPDGRSGPGDRDHLVRGLALLAGGRPAAAIPVLDPDRVDPAGDPALAGATRLARGGARLLAGDPAGSADLEAGIALAESAGWGWLARLGRLLLGAATTGSRPSTPPIEEAEPWAAGIGAILSAWLRPDDRAAIDRLDAAIDAFARLGSPALEGWAAGLQALGAARTGRQDAGAAIVAAEAAIRRGSVSEARYLVEQALALVDPERADYHLARAAEIGRRTGLAGPPAAAGREPDGRAATRVTDAAAPERPSPARPAATTAPGPAAIGLVSIELFGGFALRIDVAELDLGAIKPRARLVLHLLALAGGAPVHREAFLAALWPETDPETAARLLHVAISSLRTALEPGTPRGGAGLVRREGDAYRLGLPPGSEIDLVAFEGLLATAAASQADGRLDLAIDALRRALERYRGDLLPEDGPAEWLVEARERTRVAAVGAARTLAELRLRAEDHAGAIQACLRGLAVDRYDDGLWRLQVEAHDRAGDRSAAHRARRGYEQMLSDLGLDPLAEAVLVPGASPFAGASAAGSV